MEQFICMFCESKNPIGICSICWDSIVSANVNTAIVFGNEISYSEIEELKEFFINPFPRTSLKN